jgi:hypothetical protein
MSSVTLSPEAALQKSCSEHYIPFYAAGMSLMSFIHLTRGLNLVQGMITTWVVYDAREF